MSKPFYITTTLPYVNADLHMGHALEFIRADIVARWKKEQGYDVFFNTGTDEHGMKIFEKAQEKGLSPQAFVDESFARFKESVAIFGLLSDIHYIRTTDPHHEQAAQAFWKRVAENGYIYKKNYHAKYCVGCEETKTESELVSGECPVHPGRALEVIEEENYFFKYSACTEKLLSFYKKNPSFVIPNFRFNEIKAFVSRGLEDFSISRLKEKMPWGIPVPGDEDHVMYVWFDALTNYISTLGWPDEGGDFTKYWKEGTPTQYCGKDNLRFQTAMWQAMLMAAELPPSYQVVINGFITAEGGVKMSKTLGNVVDPKEIVAEYGTDALRFFLAKEVSSFEDSPFTYDRFKASYNAHLANGLGNLASRILTLSQKYISKQEFSYVADPLVQESLALFDISRATTRIWERITELDKHIQETEPFKVIKVDEARGVELISGLVHTLYGIARDIAPIMPETSKKLLTYIQENTKPAEPLFVRKD